MYSKSKYYYKIIMSRKRKENIIVFYNLNNQHVFYYSLANINVIIKLF